MTRPRVAQIRERDIRAGENHHYQNRCCQDRRFLLHHIETLEAALKSNASVAHLAWTSPETVVDAFKMIEQRARAALEPG